MTAIAFQTKLKSNTIQLPEVYDLIGKEVIITVVEIERESGSKHRKWHHLGSVNLGKKMDDVNIRDFAHE